MATIKQLAGQTAIYGIAHILPRILNFVVLNLYLTYKLKDTADFGIFSDLYAYSTVILAFMVFRMDTAYFRFGSGGNHTVKGEVYTSAFVPMALLTLSMVLAMFVFDQQIANALKYPDSPHYVRWFACILGLDAITTLLYSKFRLDNRPLRFLFYRALNVFTIAAILMFFMEVLPRLSPDFVLSLNRVFGIQKELDYVFMSNLIASALVALLMIPEFLKIKLKYDWALTKKILAYSWPLVIVAVAGNVNQYAGVPLQKYFLGPYVQDNIAQMGIYGGASKIAIILNLVTVAYNYAAEPFFFNNAASKKVDIYGKAALAFTVFAVIVVLGTYFYIDTLQYLIGANYRVGLFVVPILLMSYLFLGLYYNISIWYKLADRTRIGAWISIGGLIITVILNLVLLPRLGIVGSAWASFGCFLFMMVVGFILGQKFYPIQYPVGKIITYIVICGFLMFVSQGLRFLISGFWPLTFIHTLLLLSFLAFAWYKDVRFMIEVRKSSS